MSGALKIHKIIDGQKVYKIDADLDKKLNKEDAKILVHFHNASNTDKEKNAMGIKEDNTMLSNFEGVACCFMTSLVKNEEARELGLWLRILFAYAYLVCKDTSKLDKMYSDCILSFREVSEKRGVNKLAYVKVCKTVSSLYEIVLSGYLSVDWNKSEEKNRLETEIACGKPFIVSEKYYA